MDNHDGVVTHLELDVLECEVKWALRSITMNKDSRGDRIPTESFKTLKDDDVNVLHSICQQIKKKKISSGHRTGKGQFLFQFQRRAITKTVQTAIQLCSFQKLERLCSKSFKLGFNSI